MKIYWMTISVASSHAHNCLIVDPIIVFTGSLLTYNNFNCFTPSFVVKKDYCLLTCKTAEYCGQKLQQAIPLTGYCSFLYKQIIAKRQHNVECKQR